MKEANKFWKIFDRIIEIQLYLSCLIFLLAAVAVSIDVLMRYFFAVTFTPIFEITEFGLLWATFLGAPWLLKKHGHVKIEILTGRLSRKPRRVVQLFSSAISGLLLLGMVIISIKLTYVDFQYDFKLSGVLRATKWPIEIIIPIGFLFLFLENTREFIRRVKDTKVKKLVS